MAIPAILNEHPNRDDLARSLSGYSRWREAGRPLADLLMSALNFGPVLSDLSPLTQLIAMGFMGFAALRVVKMIDAPALPPELVGVAASMLFLNPFFIENLAYKFDAGFMALAVVLAVLGGQVSIARRFATFGFVTCITVLTLVLYQPAINILPVVAMLTVATRWNSGARGFGLSVLIEQAVGLAVGLAIYSVVIPPIFLAGWYAIEHGRSVTPDLAGLLKLISSVYEGTRYIFTSFTRTQQVVVVTLAALGQIGALWCALRLVKGRSDLRALVAGLVVVLTPVAAFVLSYGFIVLSENNVLVPRVYLGFGIFLAVSAYFAIDLFVRGSQTVRADSGRVRAAGVTLATVAVVPTAVLALAIGNAATNARQAQQELDIRIADQLVWSWAALGLPEPSDIIIVGQEPRAPRASLQVKRYPLIGRLLHNTIDDNFTFGPIQLRYYGLNVKQPTAQHRKAALKEAEGKPAIFDGRYFSIVTTSLGPVVTFKD